MPKLILTKEQLQTIKDAMDFYTAEVVKSTSNVIRLNPSTEVITALIANQTELESFARDIRNNNLLERNKDDRKLKMFDES